MRCRCVANDNEPYTPTSPDERVCGCLRVRILCRGEAAFHVLVSDRRPTSPRLPQRLDRVPPPRSALMFQLNGAALLSNAGAGALRRGSPFSVSALHLHPVCTFSAHILLPAHYRFFGSWPIAVLRNRGWGDTTSGTTVRLIWFPFVGGVSSCASLPFSRPSSPT